MKHSRLYRCFVCCILLCSIMVITGFAVETDGSSASDSEDVTYPWYVLWQVIVDHEMFADEAPGRPFNVSPRLWYAAHNEPSQTYLVEIVFVGYKPVPREIIEAYREAYAEMRGYDDFDSWLTDYKDNEQEMNAYREYTRAQQQQWQAETNKPLVEHYLRPDEQYTFNESVTDMTMHVMCELTWERILEIAATEDCRNVWLDLDSSILVGGINPYPDVVLDPADSSTNDGETVTQESDATEETTTQVVEAESTITEVPTETQSTSQQQIETQQNEIESCAGTITTSIVGIIILLCSAFVFKKKE